MKYMPPRSVMTLWLALVFATLSGLLNFAHAQTPETSQAVSSPAMAPAESAEPKREVVAPVEAVTPVSSDTTGKAPEKSTGAESLTEHETVTAEAVVTQEAEASKPSKQKKEKRLRNLHGGHHGNNSVFGVLRDNTLAEDDEADAVVSILGSSTAYGKVRDAVVSILGSSTSSNEVGGDVVSILGKTRVTDGSVRGSAVAVLGSNTVNGHVRGGVVAILGNVELGPEAVIEGEIVCIGGEVRRDPKAVVKGAVNNVAFGRSGPLFDGLTAWVTQCLLYGRPLAFGPDLAWAWWIAFAYLGLYAFLALVAPSAVLRCVGTLEERPGKSILAGVLALVLTPVAYVLLALTVFIAIGVALIPIFSLGLFFAGIFGKVVMLTWLGRRVTKLFSSGGNTPAVICVLAGGVIILGLYTVPVLGFVVYKLLGILGLGVVIYTLLLTIKSSRPPARVTTVPVPEGSIPPVNTGFVGENSNPIPTPAALYSALPPVISASTLPRAGFWIRLAATLLDVIMVAAVFGMMDGIFSWFFNVSGSFPLWFAIYNVAMWATKGTTIGGIICGLKVVRLDDRPLDWGVAIVRGLSAFLSLVVAGLGFIWVAFDDDRQSWHDKIAGTTIVLVPKGTSLL